MKRVRRFGVSESCLRTTSFSWQALGDRLMLNSKYSILSVMACGALLAASGCTSKSRSESAQVPPPPSLSTPVRPEPGQEQKEAATPRTAPAEDYGFMKQQQQTTSNAQPVQPEGTVQALPSVNPNVAPADQPVAAVAPVQSAKPMTATQTSTGSLGIGPGGSKTYQMQKGDTLYGVARKFNVAPSKLIAANNFKDPNHLPVGTMVAIP